MNDTTGRSPRGFTLVEMLVVIAIIGVIAAVLIPTLYQVLSKGKETVIAQDLNQLQMQVAEYKNRYGDYPPDCTNPQLVLRHLRTAFPRFADTWVNTNIMRVDGTLAEYLDASNNLVKADLATLDPSEALVFWLGSIRDDTRMPLNGSAELKEPYGFDPERLVDPDNDGWYSYAPPDGEDTPYVYFDARSYAIAGWPKNLAAANQPWNPVPLVVPYAVKPTAAATVQYANATTYQIISAGLDGDFGEVAVDTNGIPVPKLFRDPSTMTLEDLDNIANFSDGKPFEDLIE